MPAPLAVAGVLAALVTVVAVVSRLMWRLAPPLRRRLAGMEHLARSLGGRLVRSRLLADPGIRVERGPRRLAIGTASGKHGTAATWFRVEGVPAPFPARTATLSAEGDLAGAGAGEAAVDAARRMAAALGGPGVLRLARPSRAAALGRAEVVVAQWFASRPDAAAAAEAVFDCLTVLAGACGDPSPSRDPRHP